MAAVAENEMRSELLLNHLQVIKAPSQAYHQDEENPNLVKPRSISVNSELSEQ